MSGDMNEPVLKNMDEVKHQRVQGPGETVKARDNERCVLSGANELLEVHHVFSFKKFIPLHMDSDNGIALHPLIEYFFQFFNEILK